jgi:4-aminobutyrate aminotransferase
MDHRAAFAFQTVHGNPISAAAALAVLTTIERDHLTANARDVGQHLMDELQRLQQKHLIIGDVRGRGLAIGIELVKDRTHREPARAETAMTAYRAYELGAVLYYVGVDSNVLELTPPLILTKEQASAGVALLDQALSDVTEGRFDADKLSSFQGW